MPRNNAPANCTCSCELCLPSQPNALDPHSLCSFPCTAQLSVDLNPLKSNGEGYTVQAGGYAYILDVCAPVPCPNNDIHSAGACQSKPSDSDFAPLNMGVANGKLQFRDGQLSLVYTGGAVCSHSQTHRQTVILFTCDRTAGAGAPTFDREEDGCHYIFEWRTAYACYGEVDCHAIDGVRGIDFHLDALMRKDSNWIASDSRENGKYEYELNVCRPLVARPGWDCGPFAAACQKTLKGGGSDHEIGFVAPPAVDADGTLVLMYEGGEPCVGTANKRSTRIEFECDPRPGMLGNPVFEFEADCLYHFSWKTSAACDHDSKPPAPTGDCTAVDPSTGDKYDLSTLGEFAVTDAVCVCMCVYVPFFSL